MLTAVGASFHGWFLVALCKEARLIKTCWLVRLEIRPGELQILDEPERDESAPLAA
jgi:hypothetical protein